LITAHLDSARDQKKTRGVFAELTTERRKSDFQCRKYR
jgi:hypothetical protein